MTHPRKATQLYWRILNHIMWKNPLDHPTTHYASPWISTTVLPVIIESQNMDKPNWSTAHWDSVKTSTTVPLVTLEQRIVRELNTLSCLYSFVCSRQKVGGLSVSASELSYPERLYVCQLGAPSFPRAHMCVSLVLFSRIVSHGHTCNLLFNEYLIPTFTRFIHIFRDNECSWIFTIHNL